MGNIATFQLKFQTPNSRQMLIKAFETHDIL